MNEKTILLNNIKPNEYNPNEMTDAEFLELVQEVKHLGKPPKPIVLRNKGEFFEIVDGEHSYRALKELGHKELQQGWFELVEYDDIEARRQTYKRNLGGTNNPVKLGLMFSQALQESGISNRQLAEQWGISETTIRNYLFYANASKLRNDFANLAKLSREQVKLYLVLAEIAKPIADYWLSCGALEDALIWYMDEKYHPTYFQKSQTTFIEIMKQGADKLLHYKTDDIPLELSPEDQKRYIQKFKNGIKRAYKMASLKVRMEKYFSFGKERNEKLSEYLDLYFNSPLSLTLQPNQMDSLFTHIIKRNENQLEFLLTPDELRECMQLGKDEGYYTLINKAKLMIAKKHQLAPSEIKPHYSWGGIELLLDDVEIDMKAPDYVKQTKWLIPRKFKLAFLEIKFNDDEQRKAKWELLEKRLKLGDFKNTDHDSVQAFKQKMEEILATSTRNEQKAKEQEALRQKSEIELSALFVERISTLLKGSEEARQHLIQNMSKNFSKELLYLFVYLANKYYAEREHQEWYKSMLLGIRDTLKKRNKGGEL